MKTFTLRLSFFFSIVLYVATSTPALSKTYKGKLYLELSFSGEHITYKGQEIKLGSHAFFIDGSLTNEQATENKYVYKSIKEAAKHLSQGTEENPMMLYIAPWVYWLDNPDDPEVRIPKEGSNTPFGLEINCEWLSFIGLSENAEYVILACNRGQTMGAKGNFTMLNIKGDGTYAENLTFGNYCNLDLEYPLNPELNRKKRGSAIMQAQLIFSNGDKVFCRNTHFISRLNLGPFWGSKRTLFHGCHFESTDDALNGSAVYLNCTLDFHSSKPFGHTSGTGAVFLNCDMRLLTRNTQYLVKGGGPVTLVDNRFSGNDSIYLGWRDLPATEARYYQYQVSLNGKAVLMDKNNALATVNMDGKDILDAYRFQSEGETIYNTYNLLRGNDDWDPMNIKEKVKQAEKEQEKNCSSQATLLEIKPTRKKLETGIDSILLKATAFRFGNFSMDEEPINWSLDSSYQNVVKLKVESDGTCLLIPTNKMDETIEIVVNVSTKSGLESAAVFYIAPQFLPAPTFIQKPQIVSNGTAELRVMYTLDMPYQDESLITWYRCSNAQGKDPIEIAVSRFNAPMYNYKLSSGDIGWYIMASVSPKHLRCHAGKAVSTFFPTKISAKDVGEIKAKYIPNLKNMSGAYQPKVLPGFWSFDSYAPSDTKEWYWVANNTRDPWYYGPGINGAAKDTGFVQNTKGARMRFQPAGERFGDMKISFIAVPAKTAGQGFSSARAQYMDIGIKMDLENMNGYALRLIRTTKYGDAIDFILMEYSNGVAKPISEAVSASCYRKHCAISIQTKDNKMEVHAENLYDYYSKQDETTVKRVVDMEVEITPSLFGGISFQHTGSVRSGATLIKDLKIEWK